MTFLFARKSVLAGCAALAVIGGTLGVTLKSGHSQQSNPPVLGTVSNRVLASHGVELRSVDAGRRVDEQLLSDIRGALAYTGFPVELAEEPQAVRFAKPIPGIPATAEGSQLWAVVLAAEPPLGGHPGAPFKPHPQGKGTYWVAFYSPETRLIEYAVAGERVAE